MQPGLGKQSRNVLHPSFAEVFADYRTASCTVGRLVDGFSLPPFSCRWRVWMVAMGELFRDGSISTKSGPAPRYVSPLLGLTDIAVTVTGLCQQ